jgi:hypothetical protein
MIVLYRKGNSHEVDGIKCEAGRFPTKQLHARLADGWVTDPRNIEAEEEWETTSGPVETSGTETDARLPEEPQTSTETPPAAPEEPSGVTMEVLEEAVSQAQQKQEPSEEDIRQAAKAAGIKGWHNTGLEKLKGKLAKVASE